MVPCLNMFAPTRALLHTYNRHDHHHHHHHHNHHFYLHKGSKFATPYEQYVDWGNNINFICMRDQNSPPPMSNILVGVITSTLSSWPPEVTRGATAGLQRTCLKTNPHEDPCRPNVSVLRNCVTVHCWGSRISKSAVFDGLFELMPHAL